MIYVVGKSGNQLSKMTDGSMGEKSDYGKSGSHESCAI